MRRNNNNHHQNKNRKKKKHKEEEEENDAGRTPDRFKLWREGPNFDTDQPQNVLALEGKTAFLSCRVFDRENKTVSELV